MNEEWRTIQSLPLYEVSNLGRVRSQYRRGRRSPDGILKARPDRKGYLTVFPSMDCKKSSVKVHGLVAEAFLGPQPMGHDAHHKDENKQNNIPENLEYICHCKHISMNKRGEKAYAAKMDREKILTIRWYYRLNFSQAELCKMFGINCSTMHSIIHRKTWRHI